MIENTRKHGHYYQAISRMLSNTTIVVPKGTVINNDSVAVEAGRKPGAIKSGRESNTLLIQAIDEARAIQASTLKKTKPAVKKDYKSEAEHQRALLEASIGREIMLHNKLHELEAELQLYKSSKIVRLPTRNDKGGKS
ncbi:hypothetical protein AWU82_03600 [Pseudomonas glycinae]|uniref:Transposase n=2 Tax=Pseudomonas TaxID=286 RepID=A0ABM5ZG86_9PSED|nr:hypothetical protein [Pseudomonas cremoricolorata]AMQ82399.1 hypothetical protein AWU82_03600 [Pseudomonas glycinae]